MTTDTSERGLESLIMRHMTGTEGLAQAASGAVFKQFSDNESFRRWLSDTVFALTYD